MWCNNRQNLHLHVNCERTKVILISNLIPSASSVSFFVFYINISRLSWILRSSVSSLTMAATRRLQKELAEIRGSANRSFRDVQVDETNLLIWQGLIVPEKTPYNKVRSEICQKAWGELRSSQHFQSPGRISDRHSLSPGISFQATETLLQDEDLSSQHRWEGSGKGELIIVFLQEILIFPQNWIPAAYLSTIIYNHPTPFP